MKDMADLISAMASLSWPLLTALVMLMLRPALRDLIRSARTRKFTIKVGGQELTMEEANDQQQALIADLQLQVLALKQTLQRDPATTVPGTPEGRPTVTGPPAVLWVDDEPKHNSYFVQQLAQQGVPVDLALSTQDGLQHFSQKPYTLVISDLGRREGKDYNPVAGLDLLKAIRQQNPAVPFILYARLPTSRRSREAQQQALALGATRIITSPTELTGLLQSTFGGVDLTPP